MASQVHVAEEDLETEVDKGARAAPAEQETRAGHKPSRAELTARIKELGWCWDGLRAAAGSKVESEGSRTGAGSEVDSEGSLTGVGSGVDSEESWTGAGSWVDSEGSQTGAGSGVDSRT